MKKIALLLALGVTAVSCHTVTAASNDVFLCMRADSSMAYQSVNGGLLDYVEMKDSGGAIATAKIIDESTYLPFRYIAETAGLTEATGNTVGTNSFKYENRGNGIITVATKSTRVSKEVNEVFAYETDGGDKYEFKIVNIDGSLYFPMRYMAALVKGEVDYQPESGNIYFMSSDKIKKDFLNDDKSIKYKKLTSVGYHEYDNALGYSDIYLRSDGETVSSVTEELRNGKTYYSVTRARKNLYYADEKYKVWTKREGESTAAMMAFYNSKNKPVDPYVLTIISYDDKLYGIEINDQSSKTGKIFKCDLDGENYKYIGDCSEAYNLCLRSYEGVGYLFYVDGETKTDIHRVNLSTGEDDLLYIHDENSDGIIKPIDIMTLDENHIAISELGESKLDIIKLNGRIYEDKSIRGRVVNALLRVNVSTPIVKISSLNYDTDNDLLFFINNTGSSYGIYCYDLQNGKLSSINTSKSIKRRISIIKMTESMYRIYHYSDAEKNEYKYDLLSVIGDGNLKLNTNITIER